MKIIIYLSEFMIPITAIFIVGYGLIKKQKVYEQFIDGAKDLSLSLMFTYSIGGKVISASGLLLWIAKAIGKYTTHIGVPADVIPIIIVRFFSSNAANTLCLDLFERCGTDSYEGFLVSIIMSCTETIFYTLSVYATAAKVTKTRWTLAGAFIATMAGVAASVVITSMVI